MGGTSPAARSPIPKGMNIAMLRLVSPIRRTSRSGASPIRERSQVPPTAAKLNSPWSGVSVAETMIPKLTIRKKPSQAGARKTRADRPGEERPEDDEDDEAGQEPGQETAVCGLDIRQARSSAS